MILTYITIEILFVNKKYIIMLYKCESKKYNDIRYLFK